MEQTKPAKIKFEDFEKLDLRIGQIITAEPHPNADKLMVLNIDLNEPEPRTIVAGIKNYYSAKELTGKKVIIISNLEPVKLRGIESNGMILAAIDSVAASADSTADIRTLSLLTTDRMVSNGSKVE